MLQNKSGSSDNVLTFRTFAGRPVHPSATKKKAPASKPNNVINPICTPKNPYCSPNFTSKSGANRQMRLSEKSPPFTRRFALPIVYQPNVSHTQATKPSVPIIIHIRPHLTFSFFFLFPIFLMIPTIFSSNERISG